YMLSSSMRYTHVAILARHYRCYHFGTWLFRPVHNAILIRPKSVWWLRSLNLVLLAPAILRRSLRQILLTGLRPFPCVWLVPCTKLALLSSMLLGLPCQFSCVLVVV